MSLASRARLYRVQGTMASSGEREEESPVALVAADENAVTIKIKRLNGPDFELATSRDTLVSELKSRVRERTEVEEVSAPAGLR